MKEILCIAIRITATKVWGGGGSIQHTPALCFFLCVKDGGL